MLDQRLAAPRVAAPAPGGVPPALSVVVPCYNERQAVAATLAGLRAALGETDAEVLVVDDGSDDGTAEVLAALTAGEGAPTVLRHERNLGYGAALKTGIRRARGEWVLITDADGSYPPEAVPRLLERAAICDMVVAARTLPGADSWVRRPPKAFLRRFASWLARRPIPDMNSGLRLFKRELAERYEHLLPDGFSFTTTITLALMCTGRRVAFVPIALAERVGSSKIRPVRDTLRFAAVVVRCGMYFAPLRLLAPLVAVLAAAFLGSLAYDVLVLDNLTDKTVMLLLFAMNSTLFALLADMVDKRVR